MAELARRPFAEEAVEASDESGFVEMEGKICFTAYCGAAGAGVRSMYMQIHVHADALPVPTTVYILCVHALAVAEWHTCQGT